MGYAYQVLLGQLPKYWFFEKSTNLDDLLKSNDAQATTSYTTYVKLKEVVFNPEPKDFLPESSVNSLYLKWQMKTSGPSYVYSKIYVNDVAKSTDFSTISGSYTDFSFDCGNLTYGDKIQIYGRSSGNSGTICFVRNFRLYGIVRPFLYSAPTW
ncbi:MAG: hypothetical protein ACQXXF_07535 [Thermoplasmatota archaeon]|jgi:hypothetical protein